MELQMPPPPKKKYFKKPEEKKKKINCVGTSKHIIKML